MPAWPETSSGSAALSRPPYLKVPSFAMSSRRWICFTCGLLLMVSTVSRPSKPSALVATGRLCSALYCSIWIQVGQEVVIGISAAFFALIAWAAATTSGQVAGGFIGSRPALRKASRLIHMTAVEELNGIEAMRPSGRL